MIAALPVIARISGRRLNFGRLFGLCVKDAAALAGLPEAR